MKILKPNFFPAPPRLFIKFFAKIKESISKLSLNNQMYVYAAIKEKIENFKQTKIYQMEKYDNNPIFKNLRAILGGILSSI